MQDKYKEDLKQQVGPGTQPSVYTGNCLDANGKKQHMKMKTINVT